MHTFHHQPWPVNALNCEGSQKGQRKSLQLWNFEWKNWGRVDEVNICWFHKQDCLGKGLPWFNFKYFSFQTESSNRLLWEGGKPKLTLEPRSMYWEVGISKLNQTISLDGKQKRPSFNLICFLISISMDFQIPVKYPVMPRTPIILDFFFKTTHKQVVLNYFSKPLPCLVVTNKQLQINKSIQIQSVLISAAKRPTIPTDVFPFADTNRSNPMPYICASWIEPKAKNI